MAKEVYLDASASVKRYVPETGSAVIHHLFEHPHRPRLICLSLGILEIISTLVRKKNASLIPVDLYQQALLNLRSEIIDAVGVAKLSAGDPLVYSAASLIDKHSINGTDAVILRSAMDLTADLRLSGNDLVLMTSDQRLIRAAQAEGLIVFNPELQSEAELDALLGP